jgi:hypothetical protein
MKRSIRPEYLNQFERMEKLRRREERWEHVRNAVLFAILASVWGLALLIVLLRWY